MNRTPILAVAVVAVLLLAGCTAGDTAPDGATTTAADTTTTTTDVDGTTTDGTATSDGTTTETPNDGGGLQYAHFVFEEGTRYEYDVVTGGVEGTLTWEVIDVSGDQVTVHLEGRLGTPFETTVTGTRAEIRGKLADTRFGELVTSGLLSPYDSLLVGHSLEVGNTWSASTAEGSGTVEITGTDTYAGADCYVAEVRVDGVVRYTGCLSPKHGLVVHSTVTPDGDRVAHEFELVEYSAGDAGGNVDDGGDDAGDGDGGDDDADARQYAHFDFREGERYEYDVEMGGTDGTFVWEVTDVASDRVTVHTNYQVGRVTFEDTVTGTESTIEGQLTATPAGAFARLGLFHPYYGHYAAHELRVKNSWSATTSRGSATYTITGTDSYAGVDCYTTEVRVDGRIRHEGCVSPELGLLIHSAVYDRSGNVEVEMTLTEYTD